jgi:hypothetical protein
MKRHLHFCILVMFVAVLNGNSAFSADSMLSSLGEAKGQVLIGGVPAAAGATLAPGSLVATGIDSTARLVLRGSEVTMRANTQVSMPTTTLGLSLTQGTLLVKEPPLLTKKQSSLLNERLLAKEQPTSDFQVALPGASVVIKRDKGLGALAEVASVGTSSKITVEYGFAEIHISGAPMLLHAGQWARLEAAGSPPRAGQSGATAAGPEAGKVTREVPQGSVQRQGKELPLVTNDPVEWNDTVHTQSKGRLMITLTDGSVLSVGSRSEMKIVKVDPEAQQTDIELITGSVKADVQKVTKSGGHFEIHTKTAVIGVVGTTLLVTSNSKGTMICNTTKNSTGEAEVTVTDANGQQTKKLKTGFCAFFPLAGAAIALGASASATTISGLTTATAIAAGAAGATVGLGTGVIVTVAAVGTAGSIVGGLGAAGAFTGGLALSPIN